MKELTHTKTVTETYGYQAYDGAFFSSKEECEKYEITAKAVIFNEFKRLFVGEDFSETQIFENFGYGSDEWGKAVIDIKNADDLHAVNMWIENAKYCDHTGGLDNSYIGKRLLVNLGQYGDFGDCNLYPRTEEELIEDFKRDIAKFFHPTPKEEKKDEDKGNN